SRGSVIPALPSDSVLPCSLSRFASARPTAANRAKLVLVAITALSVSWQLLASVLWRQTDYFVYRLGGATVAHGGSLYADHLAGTPLPFTYPPFAAMLFVPLAALPERLGQLGWAALMLIMLWAIIRSTLRRARQSGFATPAILAPATIMGLALWTDPVRQGFSLGQINLLVAGLVLADLGSTLPARWRGVLIGIAAGLKLTPLIFIPYLLITGRPRAAATALTTFAGTIALGSLAGLPQSVHFWRDVALSSAHVGGVPYVSNQSITGDVTRWIGHVPSGTVWHAVIGSFSLLGLVVARVAHRTAPIIGDVLAGLTGILVSPISWTHHLIWLSPALILIAAGDQRLDRLLCAGATLTLLVAPIWWVPNKQNREFQHHGWQLLAACSFTLVVLILMARLAVICRVPRIQADEHASRRR
ncbi:MAG: alpha,2-mannosyltransferase, partial [Pseudonocardiales bacterium]|nr:alpha,2-mannosyltransferase [Pseudonocardiales bacterium]